MKPKKRYTTKEDIRFLLRKISKMSMPKRQSFPAEQLQLQKQEKIENDFSFEPHVGEEIEERYSIEQFIGVDDSNDSDYSDDSD
jgi:hypothetical protein